MDLNFLLAGGFAALVAKYGYVATFGGTLLEGETFLVLAGLAASRGYLDLSLLLVLGAAAAFLTDNLFFALGRAFGPAILTRFPRLSPSVARAHALIERLPNTAVIGVRFLYGMRSVGPAVIGAGSMAWSRFVMLDALAALLWGSCWTICGYMVGEAVAQVLEQSVRFGRWLFVAAAIGTAIAAFIFYRRRLRARRRPGPQKLHEGSCGDNLDRDDRDTPCPSPPHSTKDADK